MWGTSGEMGESTEVYWERCITKGCVREGGKG